MTTNKMTDKPFLDIDFHQVYKHGENACGDVFMCRKFASETRAVCVLSDGLGSGVKANVLANMTATMAMNFCAGDLDIKRAAELIMRTLPVCSQRRMAYSTFTIMDIEQNGRATIMEYDNPPSIVIRAGKATKSDTQTITISPMGLGVRQVKVHNLRLGFDDRVILTSDGVTQSGMGTDAMPFGWSPELAQQLIERILKRDPQASARKIARMVTERALENDEYKAKDDITCAVAYVRRGRKLLVATGPPIDVAKDKHLAERIAQFNGRTAVCGGTTAKIVSRELKREIALDLTTVGADVPPVSRMKGIGLITEGTLTLNRAAEILASRESLKPPGRDAATQLAALLIESDIIEFLVGTRINEAHQDPNMPVDLDIRRNLVKRMAQLLQEKYLKKVEISFI